MKIRKKTQSLYIWLILILAMVFGFFWEFSPLENKNSLLESIPEKGDQFWSSHLKLNSEEQAVLGDVDVIKRLYLYKDQMVVLTAIDGTRNRHAVHDPLYCFRGSGWDILDSDRLKTPDGYVRHVTMEKGDRKNEALYWFFDRKKRHASAIVYWFQTTLRRLSLGHSGNEPILIVLQATSLEPASRNKILSDLFFENNI